MRKRMRKAHRELESRLEPLGWAVVGFTGGGHLRLRHHPSGAAWITPSTPSDCRAVRNLLADLRRLGRTGALRGRKEIGA